MRARVRKTGEIVDVYPETQLDTKKIMYKEYILGDSRKWTEDELELLIDNDEHWQDVRERAAIAAMQRTLDMITNDYQSYHNIVVEGFSGKKKTFPNEIAEFAVACADALVKQLKKGKK